MKRQDKFKDRNPQHKRIKIFLLTVTLLFVFISFRLYYLQVFRNDELSSKAINQRGKNIPIKPNRGTIFDRNLIPLTNNEKTPTLLIPKDLLKEPSIYDYVKGKTSLTRDKLNNRLNSGEKLLQIPLKEKIDISFFRENAFLVDIIDRYDKDGLLSHVIGYINEADNRGESGIENNYDEFLKMETRDSFVVEYDAKRNTILGGEFSVNQNTNPSDPNGIQITIDREIQKDIEAIMDKEKINGAIVATDVESGEILALASRPNFNPKKIEDYFTDKDDALRNKTIWGEYPPGSIFKIVVVLAALEENPYIIDKNFLCNGFEMINGVRINCNGVHEFQTLKDAFANSCNSTFIQIGKEIGGKKIIDMSKRLGFGSKINIGLLEEKEGNLPKDDDLYGPAVGHISIGQDKVEVTPLQVANMLNIIANDGIDKKLTLVKGITNIEGRMIKEYFKEDERRVISRENAKLMKEMLIEVVKRGTAQSMDLENKGGAGGKTGSSQAVYNREETVHGWFSGFYPAKKPKYTITVLIENAPRGSREAIPIFKEIIEKLK